MTALTSILFLLAPVMATDVPTLSGYLTVKPIGFHKLRDTNLSALYSVELPPNASYMLGPVLVARLQGDRSEIGRAYATLLGEETTNTYNTFMDSIFPDQTTRAVFESFADWLWSSFALPHVPVEFLEELEGMRSASPATLSTTLDVVAYRFNTLANLPADVPNMITMLESELESRSNISPDVLAMLNAVINHLTHCTWCASQSAAGGSRSRLPFSTGCDFYAAWGSRTQGGRLFSSRNLDWHKSTGIAKHKLVAVISATGATPYATFGFASGLGALAGMSAAGVTVSEANLDNSETTFEGVPFPIRLRMILERAADLASAKAIWEATNNTDSMNFLIAAGPERNALAIEAMRNFSAFFSADDAREAQAQCTLGTAAGGTCGSGFPDLPARGGRKAIGMPLTEAVFRSNHAMHPRLMATQEPLFNGTTIRYELLRQLFDRYASQGKLIGDDEAVAITAILGIKGRNFFSCEPQNFDVGDNVMSIVYAPRDGVSSAAGPARAWVSWEDGDATANTWRPAACNSYVRFNMESWW